MKIGIFGGTFDPPHIGHINAANTVKSTLGLDQMIIVPAYISPVKIDRKITSPELRLKMCEIAFTATGKVLVSDYELSKPEISYTIDTIKHFKTLYPQDELFLTVGSDSFLKFEQWKDSREIQELCTIVVVARSETDAAKLSEKQRELSKYGRVIVVEIEPINISSTKIRNNMSEYTEYLPESLVNFVKLHKLYE
jgi:nicotinate-nucleotide adenylyltransferase